MAAASDATTIQGAIHSHAIFNGQNYAPWKKRMQMEIHFALQCPLALELPPAAENQLQRRARQMQVTKAVGAIYSRLGNDVILQVNAETAIEIFAQLDNQYAARNATTSIHIQTQILNMRLNTYGDVKKNFAEMDTLISQLQDCGRDVTDEEVSQMYLANLPRTLQAVGQTASTMLAMPNFCSNDVKTAIIRAVSTLQAQSLRQKEETDHHQPYNQRGNGQRNGNGNGGNRRNRSRSNGKPNQHQGTSGQRNGNPAGSEASSSTEQPNECVTKRKHGSYRGKKFDKAKVTCHNCGKKGHYSNECTEPKQANQIVFEKEDVIRFAQMCHIPGELNGSTHNALPYAAYSGTDSFQTTDSTNDENSDESDWVGDSGCNYHILRQNPELLMNSIELTGQRQVVTLACKGGSMRAYLEGDLRVSCEIDGKYVTGILKDVIYVPEATDNFLSTVHFMENGYAYHAEDGIITMSSPAGEKIIRGKLLSNPRRIVIKLRLPDMNKAVAAGTKAEEFGSIMHRRYGHMNSKHVAALPKLVIGVQPNLKTNLTVTTCDTCANSKMKKLPNPTVRDRAGRIRELIHCDLMGPIIPMAEDGSEYILVILDDWSHFLITVNLKSKDKATGKLIAYVRKVNTIDNHKVSLIRCDHGGEFINADFESFCNNNGITLDPVPPYTPVLNSIVERMNGTIGNRIRALLYDSYIPLEWWNYAADAACYLINRSPTSALENQTPYERWHNRKPDMSHLRIFGSVARVLVPEEKRHKLDKRSWNGILVGYTSMGYKVYDLQKREVVNTREVRIDESKDIRELSNALTQNRSKSLVIQTRKQPLGIENVIVNASTKSTYTDPLTYSEAMSRSDNDKWSVAIQEEYDILRKRGVWKIIPKPDHKMMDTRWVFKQKVEGMGRIRYKARLCARSFLDYNRYSIQDIYSPTAKLSTVRLVFCLAIERRWKIVHLDVTSAFLYGDLKQHIVISVPEGLNLDPDKYALKLIKSLYSLKVSANNWNTKIKALLKKIGIVPTITEPNLFFDPSAPLSVLMVVFVDDFLVTGDCPERVDEVLKFLDKEIEIKNMGSPTKFLGMEVICTANQTKLHQEAYIVELANKFKIGTVSYGTPMESNLRLTRPEQKYPDINLREILGSLMYLAVATRPDIIYSVNYLCRFQEHPSPEILKYAKRILAYLFRTQDWCLTYERSEPESASTITLMTDAAFASDIVDRKSTSGILIKLGRNSLIWRTIKQKCVIKSTTESKYIAMSTGDSEVRGLSNILKELGFTHCIKMLADNSGAIKMAQKRDTQNCRHIDVAYRAFEESIESGVIDLEHVAGTELEADILTKSLPKPTHEKFTQRIMNINIE